MPPETELSSSAGLQQKESNHGSAFHHGVPAEWQFEAASSSGAQTNTFPGEDAKKQVLLFLHWIFTAVCIQSVASKSSFAAKVLFRLLLVVFYGGFGKPT